MHAVKEVTAVCYSMERCLALLVLLLELDIAESRAETLEFSKACGTFGGFRYFETIQERTTQVNRQSQTTKASANPQKITH